MHAGGIRHKPRQQITVRWHSTPEADSTASLIDLTCPLTTFTELSAAPLDCGSRAADVSCTTSPVQANFTALSNARMEGSLSHETALCGSQKCPNLFRSSSPHSHSLGSRLLSRESNERKLIWITRTGLSPRCSTSASLIRFPAPRKQ